MTTQQQSIAHWYGLEAAFNRVERDSTAEELCIAFGAMQEAQELPCPHDVGVFVGYDPDSGEQMYRCTMCGEVNLD